MFYFFCFFTFIPFPLSYLSLSFISSAISSISLLRFSGRQNDPQIWYHLTRFRQTSLGAFCLRNILTICSNGSTPLNKMAAIPIYCKKKKQKKKKNRTKKTLRLNIHILHWRHKVYKVRMMILGWPLTFLDKVKFASPYKILINHFLKKY